MSVVVINTQRPFELHTFEKKKLKKLISLILQSANISVWCTVQITSHAKTKYSVHNLVQVTVLFKKKACL